MRTTPSGEALKELENQVLTEARRWEWWSGRRFACRSSLAALAASWKEGRRGAWQWVWSL